MRPACSLLVFALSFVAAAAPAQDRPPDPHNMALIHGANTAAPLFNDLGTWHRAISTKSADAQRYFDQGLRLCYSFNREEAQRSFEECAKRDPDCAMCYWGIAYALGRDINVPPLPERTAGAYDAVHKALARQAKASPVERALIDALVKRYGNPQPEDPNEELKLETDYANAMRSVAKRYPNDPDVQTLFAESMMDLRPWDFWTADYKPQPGTLEIVATLESVLKRWPNHPGANHLYIHAVEASDNPGRALASAKRLETLVPGVAAAHMVHMPSHIYQQVGRYAASEEANRKAAAADSAYTSKHDVPPMWQIYMAHNLHFLAYAAQAQGRSAESIKASDGAATRAPVDMLRMMPGMDFFLSVPHFVLARFGKWDDILKLPAPPADLRYPVATWHYARGLAFSAKGQAKAAAAEQDSLDAIARAMAPDQVEDLNFGRNLLRVASHVLAGDIAEKRGDLPGAITHLKAAAAAEDSLRYSEPKDWLYPTRHHLGAVLLKAGRAAEAEAAYREDLQRDPENGWSLFGLAQSLRAQKKDVEAAQVDARFKEAWKRADVRLTASRF